MNNVFIDLQKYPIHLNRWAQNYPYKPHLRRKIFDLTLESVQFVCLGIKENKTGEIHFCMVLLAWLTVPH